MNGWNRTETDRHGRRASRGRGRRLSFERCEDRQLLSASLPTDADWVLPLRPDFAELLAALVAGQPDLSQQTFGEQFTFSARQGPDWLPVEPASSQALSEMLQQIDPQLPYSWEFQSQDVIATRVLPPTPWCDEEFRETLNALLLADGGSGGVQWSVQFRQGLITSPGSLGSSTVDWESVSLIDSGLSFQNTTRFQFSLVNVVYPLSAADSSSLTNYPALVAALKVEVFWPSVDRFWRNPLAGDMIDLVTNSAASAGAASIADNDSRGWSRALINSSIAHPWSTGWSDGPLGEAFESAPCSARSIATSAFAVREMEMDSARLPGSTLDGLGEFGWSRDEDLRFKIANETIEFGPHGFRRLTDSAELSSDGDACWDGEEDSWRQFPSFSSWTLDQWQGESPQTAATEPGPVSLLTAEATRLGFQRLLATDMVFEAMSEDLVDVGILAQEQLHVTTSATAVLAQGEMPPNGDPTSGQAVGLRGSRGSCQAFDLVHADGESSGSMPCEGFVESELTWLPSQEASRTPQVPPSESLLSWSLGDGGVYVIAGPAETSTTQRRLSDRKWSSCYGEICQSGWIIGYPAAFAGLDAARRSLGRSAPDRRAPHGCPLRRPLVG